jgi:hypothetical protein
MTKMTATVIEEIYDAWRAQNLDWLATYLPDDFSHHINIPIDLHPLGGACHGKQAVLERLDQIFRQFDTQRLDAGHIAIDRYRATVEVQTRCLHKETGACLDARKTNIWTLEEGWPVRLTEDYDLDRFRAFVSSLEQR